MLNKSKMLNFVSCLLYILKSNHYFCGVINVVLRSNNSHK